MSSNNLYCLDTNVLIQAWHKYYSPQLCPEYWKVLQEFGHQGTIFLPEEVVNEINKIEDDLSTWLKESGIPIQSVDEGVASCLKQIYSKDPIHKTLIDNTRGRSLADPWVIAHAMNSNATVVTKEEKVTASNSAKIKIPNVCEKMGVKWINDFDLLKELNVVFSCRVK